MKILTAFWIDLTAGFHVFAFCPGDSAPRISMAGNTRMAALWCMDRRKVEARERHTDTKCFGRSQHQSEKAIDSTNACACTHSQEPSHQVELALSLDAPPTYEAYCRHARFRGENLRYSSLHFFSSREHRTFGNTHFCRGMHDTLIELASASDRSSSYSSTRHVKQRGRTVGDRARREQRCQRAGCMTCMPRIIEVEHNWQTHQPTPLMAEVSCRNQPTCSSRSATISVCPQIRPYTTVACLRST
jgi:hypothetical protein